MSEYREMSERKSHTADEKIDITGLVIDFFQGIKKLWWLIIVLTLFFSVKTYFGTSSSYIPQYVASATATVSSMTGTSAGDMAKVFPYILTSGVLKDVVAEDLGLEYMPGNLNVEADEDTNLLTISVSAGDPQVAYNTLASVLKNYPEVAKFVVGETKLVVLDETGIPSDVQREEVMRGSYKRGALKGFLIGMAILLFYVLTRRTVKSKKEIKKQINLPDCGSIPYIREKKRKKDSFQNSLNLMNERISQGYVEALRKVRIKVMREMEEKEMKTLLVTSSVPGEGKTTLAVNLAISMAQQGRNVILVDCDLRHPSVAKVMNEENAHPGLGSILGKKVSLKESIVNMEMGTGSLKIVFGNEEDDDTKLLASKRMRALIHSLKKQADIVILDTAPSGLLADAPILAKYVDAALYVIRYDHTKMRQIREGVSTLAMSGIHMVGYVFNSDVSSRASGYGYGGYGSYGSYGRYGRYGAYRNKTADGHYGSYGQQQVGTEDSYGRVIKD